ncbi:MAG: hypothetical protein IPL14_04820 [Nitrospira sp.]|nr:hypothetical protein [Nitrospira sp.]
MHIYFPIVMLNRSSIKLIKTLARTIHEYLLRRSILSPGGVVLFGLLDGLEVRLRRPVARSPGGLRSRTPRDDIHE